MPRLQSRRGKLGGSNNSNGNRRGTGGSTSSAPAKKPSDPLHNGEQPCCQDLATYCRQVLGAVKDIGGGGSSNGAATSGSGSGSTPPTLHELVAEYLCDLVRSLRASQHSPTSSPEGKDPAASAAAEAASAAKKRKNKKKKTSKKKKSAAEASLAATPSSAAEVDGGDHQDEGDENDNDNNEEGENGRGSHGEATALAISFESSAPAAEGVGTHPNDCLTTPTRPQPNGRNSRSPPPPTLLDLMVQDYFAGAATQRTLQESSSKNGSKASPTKAATTHTTTAGHDLFWDRIVAESKHFQVKPETINAALASIACPRCRSKVADELQAGHKVQIHSFRDDDEDDDHNNHRSSSLSVSPSSPFFDHQQQQHPYPYGDESYYARLEEGRLDGAALKWFREQQHDLHFQFTVGHDDDEEMGWKLRGMGLDADDDVDDTNTDDEGDDNHNDNVTGAGNGNKKMKKKGGKGKGASNAAAKPAAKIAGAAEDWRKYVLYHYLLGRGLAADDLFRNDDDNNQNAQPSSAGAKVGPISDSAAVDRDLVRAVASSALSTVTGYDTTLKDCRQSLKKQEDLLAQNDEHYLGHSGVGDVNLTGFQILSDADQVCCQTLGQQLRILLELSQWLFVAATAVRGDDAPAWQQIDLGHMQDTVLDMWEAWLQVVQVIVSEMAQYESLLQNLADRQGRFPLAFKSPAYRDLYRNLVRTKLVAASWLVDKMHELIDAPLEVPGVNPHDRKAPLSRKLVAGGVFCQHFWGIDHTKQPPPTKLDEDMRGVLDSIRECVETPHQSSWMQVQQEHEIRRERLFRRCKRVLVESSHLGCADGVIRRMLVGSVSATVAVNPSVEQGDPSDSAEADHAASTTRYRENLKAVGMQMVRGWLRERCHERSNGSPVIPIMPLSLSVQIVNGLHEAGCDVSCFTNAKTRAASILVAMFYRWMSDQCDAWRAEIVAQELLTSMATLDSPSPGTGGTAVSGPSKAGKKKKKKGADGPASSPSKQTTKSEDVAQTLQLTNDTPDPPSELMSPGIDQTAGMDESLLGDTSVPGVNGATTVSTADDELPIVNGHKSAALNESVNAKEAAQDPVSLDLNEEGAGGMSPVENFSALDAFISIGVDCESSFEPVEDFLVGRLMSILKPSS